MAAHRRPASTREHARRAGSDAYGHRKPASTATHERRHDSQIAQLDRHHAARNREHGHHVSEGGRSAVGGGLAGAKDLGNKARDPKPKNEMGAFKRAMGGSVDSPSTPDRED